jgi:hypothetical protein
MASFCEMDRAVDVSDVEWFIARAAMKPGAGTIYDY